MCALSNWPQEGSRFKAVSGRKTSFMGLAALTYCPSSMSVAHVTSEAPGAAGQPGEEKVRPPP